MHGDIKILRLVWEWRKGKDIQKLDVVKVTGFTHDIFGPENF